MLVEKGDWCGGVITEMSVEVRLSRSTHLLWYYHTIAFGPDSLKPKVFVGTKHLQYGESFYDFLGLLLSSITRQAKLPSAIPDVEDAHRCFAFIIGAHNIHPFP